MIVRLRNTQKALIGLAVVAASAVILSADPPKGWFMAGSKPADYESSVDTGNALNGQPSAYLRSTKPVVDGFGTLMQNFAAGPYIGKRVRLSAFVKSEKVERWSGLWVRVDGKSGAAPLAFDNMQNRAIKGTTGWQNYEVVLDVPEGATGVFLGILLDGPGTVWMNSTKFEEVGTNIPTTDIVKAPAQGPHQPWL